ncbi:hypothetical protein TNCV_4121221 [Trichonephila clavipes]|nr:hypothetical protein TNCV_4121221 [Trichonephila clavipes]
MSPFECFKRSALSTLMGDLTSDIAPETGGREKTPQLDTCKQETPSAIRGFRTSPSQDYGVERGLRRKRRRERLCCLLPPK